MPGEYPEDYDDDPPVTNAAPQAPTGEGDFLAEMTGGAVTTEKAAKKGLIKGADHFGGPLLEGAAVGALALLDGEGAQQEREALARRLGTTTEVIEKNSAALRALAEEEQHENKVGRALVEWMPSAIGAGLGFFVPIPGSSLLFGYLGDQVGDAINPGNPHEVNVRDIAKEVERKQEAGEKVTKQEAFFLALSPEDRKIVYEQMKAQIPEGTDPLVAQQRMRGIIVDNSHLIRDKVEALGLKVEAGGDASAVLANAMNKVNPETGVKLHPIMALLDHPDNTLAMEQDYETDRMDGDYAAMPPQDAAHTDDPAASRLRTPDLSKGKNAGLTWKT